MDHASGVSNTAQRGAAAAMAIAPVSLEMGPLWGACSSEFHAVPALHSLWAAAVWLLGGGWQGVASPFGSLLRGDVLSEVHDEMHTQAMASVLFSHSKATRCSHCSSVTPENVGVLTELLCQRGWRMLEVLQRYQGADVPTREGISDCAS